MDHAITPSLLLISQDEELYGTVQKLLIAYPQQPELARVDTPAAGSEKLRSGNYHAVLMDAGAGLQTTLHFLNEHNLAHCPYPLLVFSNRPVPEEDVRACFAAGADDFLTPQRLSPVLFEHALRAALAQKQAQADVQALKQSLATARNELARLKDRSLVGETVLQQITQQQQTQEQLNKVLLDMLTEKNLLLAVMETLQSGVAILDLNGGVIQTNSAYERIWGKDRPEVHSSADYRAYQAWWVENGKPLKEDEWAPSQVLRTGLAVNGQYLYIRRFDGGYRYVLNSAAPVHNATGKIIGCAVSIVDVTSLAQTEQALSESEERFRVALKSVPLLVYTCDRERRYTWIYDPQRAYQIDRALGKRDDEIMPPEAVVELVAFKQWALNTGQAGVREIKINMPEGAKYFLITVEPLKDSAGQVTGLTCSAINMTREKLLEIDEREHHIQIEIQRRMSEYRERERQELARNLHDGPIQGLIGAIFNLQVIKQDVQSPDRKNELNQIGMSLKQLVQDLRGMVNELRPPALIRFGLSKSIRIHAEEFQGKYPHIRLDLDLDEDNTPAPEEVCITLFRIYQEALRNIVHHAQASRAWVRLRFDPDGAKMTIGDNGQGFETADNLTWLIRTGHFGLAGMKERAEALDGALFIHSDPGAGTIIEVSIPFAYAT